jgi:glycosyltransferase involved in cell wall biosynthesis
MDRPPLVTVIVIFLNEARFLQEAIDSVVHQTSPDWELLLIDDGSTDRSAEIAQQRAARDPARVRYLTHEGGRNRGKSVSRNLGLHAARGEYVTFLDGDDVFRPEKVERQCALLSNSPAVMVYGPTLYWHRWPGAPPGASSDHKGRLGVAPDRIHEAPKLLTMFLLDGGTVPRQDLRPVCSVCGKRMLGSIPSAPEFDLASRNRKWRVSPDETAPLACRVSRMAHGVSGSRTDSRSTAPKGIGSSPLSLPAPTAPLVQRTGAFAAAARGAKGVPRHPSQARRRSDRRSRFGRCTRFLLSEISHWPSWKGAGWCTSFHRR